MATETTVKVATQTGAAKDDLLTASMTGLTEDNLSASLKVLDNDPGAARLYSLVQDPASYGAGAQFPVVANAVLASGARIAINADGTIAYDAGALRAALQGYADGETFTDSFVYTVRMANGALSTARVTVTIAGANDAPTLATISPASIYDTAAADAPAAVTGTLDGRDVDHGSVLTYSLADGTQLTGPYGALTFDPHTGAYSFRADAGFLNSLADGETATAHFGVQVKDEKGAASAPIDLAFKLVGANDTAAITGNGTGAVGEDGTLAANGALTVTDLDHDQAVFQAPASVAGTYGDFSFNSTTGQWSYALRNGDANVQALNGGKLVSDQITVASLDGTATATLHVDITGANDAASVGGNGSGAVTEDSTDPAHGKLVVADVDSGEAAFRAPASLAGAYGDFIFDKDTGEWTYALRNGDANVQALNGGKLVSDEITVTSFDGTATATLHVDIAGVNDAASIGGNGNGAVTEDGATAANGKVVVSDADSGEAVFQAPASVAGTYGDFSFDKDTGEWSYALRNGAANVQALGGGKLVSDEITVTSLDGTATKTLHVDVTGTNDAASISGNGSGAVTEDGTSAASGNLAVSDVDSGEAAFRAPASLAGTYGDFIFDKDTGAWSYALRNGAANVQALNAGKIVSDEIVVTSLDGTATATLHVDITGVNDAASIGGNGSGAVTEDGATAANGKVVVSDADSGEAVFQAPASVAGTYGDFSFDKDTGEWSYTLRNGAANVQALGGGKLVSDEITVTSLDGTATKTLHVDVTGTNDAASITGNGSGAVTEDGTSTASGNLAVSDVDSGEAVFRAPASLAGTYGDFIFDKDTGAWSYALRNGDANVQALNGGKLVSDEITVTSFDGTASTTLHVDVTGKNDAAAISGNATGVVSEDNVLTASGTLAVQDADTGETAFRTPTSLSGTYGDFSFNKDTGAWSYALRNGAANVQALNAGTLVSDELVVTSLDGTASATLHVDVTGKNDAAAISGNATSAVSEDNVLTASGTLTVQDADAGEAAFRAPASLSGTYGDFSFNKDTGEWSYALRNGAASVQALNAGKLVSDQIVVTSLDGTASATLHVDITGKNDAAAISGNATGAVSEDNVLTASGVLTVADADAGEAAFRAPASLSGTYGDFSFNKDTGAWSYALRNGDANVQALVTGQVVTDQLVVSSLDGSASGTISVSIAGANEPVINPVTTWTVNRGQADANGRIVISGFDSNDVLAYSNNLTFNGIGMTDTDGDGRVDSDTATFTFDNGNTHQVVTVILVGYLDLAASQVHHA